MAGVQSSGFVEPAWPARPLYTAKAAPWLYRLYPTRAVGHKTQLTTLRSTWPRHTMHPHQPSKCTLRIARLPRSTYHHCVPFLALPINRAPSSKIHSRDQRSRSEMLHPNRGTASCCREAPSQLLAGSSGAFHGNISLHPSRAKPVEIFARIYTAGLDKPFLAKAFMEYLGAKPPTQAHAG